jgi:pyruvate kinase
MPFLSLDAPHDGAPPQLVVTLGPASLPHVHALAQAGATSFRLNASHLDADSLAAALRLIRAACPDAPVVADLQGAKMRVEIDGQRDLRSGDTVRFSLDGRADVRVPHAEFFRHARVGDTLSLDDAKLRLKVERVSAGALEARALNEGRLVTRKGINVDQHPVRLEGLTVRDLDALRVATHFGVNVFAYSFMTDGREAAWLRDAAPGCRVVGKIERAEAADRLSVIAGAVDAVWVCRGDLGAQLGLPEMASFVAGVDPRQHAVPVLMAGQVLEHLTGHPEPTRSEACHLYDVLDRGYSGIVLSDETAIGNDPVHATGVAAMLLSSFRH